MRKNRTEQSELGVAPPGFGCSLCDERKDTQLNENEGEFDARSEIEALKIAQATQVAAMAGAQATLAAVDAGSAATSAAVHAGTWSTMVAGAGGLVAGLFLGMAIVSARND